MQLLPFRAPDLAIAAAMPVPLPGLPPFALPSLSELAASLAPALPADLPTSASHAPSTAVLSLASLSAAKDASAASEPAIAVTEGHAFPPALSEVPITSYTAHTGIGIELARPATPPDGAPRRDVQDELVLDQTSAVIPCPPPSPTIALEPKPTRFAPLHPTSAAPAANEAAIADAILTAAKAAKPEPPLENPSSSKRPSSRQAEATATPAHEGSSVAGHSIAPDPAVRPDRPASGAMPEMAAAILSESTSIRPPADATLPRHPPATSALPPPPPQSSAPPLPFTTAPAPATEPPAAQPRLDFASPHFVQDVAIAIARRPAGLVPGDELVLRIEPADMGRISVELRFTGEGGLEAVLSADQPRVLDQLRAHSAELHRSLLEAGGRGDIPPPRFEARPDTAASPSFAGGQGSATSHNGGGQSQEQSQQPARASSAYPAEAVPAPQPSPQRPTLVPGRLDLIA